ncbi:MAG: co-chaperone GroES [Planctomycetota bacterium]|nr:MAG: co-chaperone GroES [Planctomycetota bacterium]
MAQAIKPIGNHVLVQRATPAEVSKGGIVLPETAKDKPKEGKIIAIGNGKVMEDGKRASFQVKAGDRVIFTSYAGTEVTHQGEEYLVMEESDILAVVD